MSIRYPIAVIGLAVVCIVLATAQEHEAQHWGYEGPGGPERWGDLEPEFSQCKNGMHQSPIDIRNPQKSDLPPIQFDYKPVALNILDNGHTIQINYPTGSSIRVGNKQYELKQFHFHRPSEEKIKGKDYDMVAHLVHADQDGNLAVVAVLLQKGGDNPLLQELWKDLPTEKGKEERLESVQINVANLLPANRRYYTFLGSLTTPPCSESVTWFVLKKPVAVSAAEIDQFAKLYPHNARPTQPLNGRTVQESKSPKPRLRPRRYPQPGTDR